MAFPFPPIPDVYRYAASGIFLVNSDQRGPLTDFEKPAESGTDCALMVGSIAPSNGAQPYSALPITAFAPAMTRSLLILVKASSICRADHTSAAW